MPRSSSSPDILSIMASPDSNSTSIMNDLPATILESFLPGFGFIRRTILSSLGYDVTSLVLGCFVLVGALSASQYIWKAFVSFAERYLMSNITVEADADELYSQVMQWVSTHVVTSSSRSLTARPSFGNPDILSLPSSLLLGSDDSKPFDFSLLQSELPVSFLPYFGDHGFWHQGRWFLLRREKRDVTFIGNGSANSESVETISIKTFGFSPQPIKDLLQLCKKEEAERNRTLTTIRRPHRRADMWQQIAQRPSRSWDTVFMDKADKDLLLKDAMEFLHPLSHRFYASRGIPYRRGYLLYGPAGTGKTTISMVLSGYFGLDLCVLSLVESSMTDERLGTLFSQLPSRCIILLEDIDAAGLERREELDTQAKEASSSSTDAAATPVAETSAPIRPRPRQRARNPDDPNAKPGVTLSGLLNALDGVASQEGRILIMTTNDPEALDKALIRPGRVDLQVYFGYLSRANAKGMFVRMYTDDAGISAATDSITVSERTRVAQKADTVKEALESLAKRFADFLPEKTFTPAEVQGFLLSRRKSPEKAMAEVEAWRDELIKAKERGTNIIKTVAVKVEEEESAVTAT